MHAYDKISLRRTDNEIKGMRIRFLSTAADGRGSVASVSSIRVKSCCGWSLVAVGGRLSVVKDDGATDDSFVELLG